MAMHVFTRIWSYNNCSLINSIIQFKNIKTNSLIQKFTKTTTEKRTVKVKIIRRSHGI